MKTKQPPQPRPTQIWATKKDGDWRLHRTQGDAIDYLSDTPMILRDPKEWIGKVLLLPLDPASVQGMREKIADAIDAVDLYADSELYTNAVLAALNITTPRRTKGKKGAWGDGGGVTI
jgi:hypothetical protein